MIGRIRALFSNNDPQTCDTCDGVAAYRVGDLHVCAKCENWATELAKRINERGKHAQPDSSSGGILAIALGVISGVAATLATLLGLLMRLWRSRREEEMYPVASAGVALQWALDAKFAEFVGPYAIKITDIGAEAWRTMMGNDNKRCLTEGCTEARWIGSTGRKYQRCKAHQQEYQKKYQSRKKGAGTDTGTNECTGCIYKEVLEAIGVVHPEVAELLALKQREQVLLKMFAGGRDGSI